MPEAAWSHKLGNRSAIDWVLDQHKEKSRAIQPSAKNSTLTASPTTKRRLLTCWAA
ncbi:hypothetical protein [Methyloceanibacter stevinii]|uniref:hypothetical protein n=1 Tax=Methyloceanibacter stevinii TaxID=1774970 RepID=UPI0031394F07